jgi:eukaryotic-like serine/threonine-protein kinase
MTDTARLTAALADRYRVERELGEGGMATVYLAYDVRHDRHVALKVLRPELAAIIGADRFLKEIKVTAHLQHPHILGLIDSGEAGGLLYYVMPFVEGQSLRDRLTHEKQLPIDDAVRITSEVASALDYADRHGVIHRDIKPENILLHEGQALVADFGIALAVSAAGGTRMTETGMSLGTPHYMSPEQAMGERELTARSDVYALGAVLYEMLVGEPPFTGPTAQAIVAKVVTETPRPLIAQRHTVPPHVEAAVLMALEKLPADRFASTAAFAEALARPSVMTARGARTMVRESRAWDVNQWRRLTMAVVVLAVAYGTLATWGWLRVRELVVVSRFPVTLGGQDVASPANTADIAISPDGAHIVYSDTLGRLMLRDRDRLAPTPVPDGETGVAPFFSPAGGEVAFYTGYPGALRSASLTGGAARVLVRDSTYAVGGAWDDDGWIYYIGGAAQALFRVRAEGGKPQLVARPDTARDELFFNWPQLLPGHRAALVTIRRRRGAADIAAIDIASGKTTVLTRGVQALYAHSGHLIVGTADGAVQAVRFDPRNLTLGGRPVTVINGVSMGSISGGSNFALSNTGTFFYHTTLPEEQVVRVTRDGRAQPVDAEWGGLFLAMDLSPDGTRLAITVVREDRLEIWVKALETGTLTRVQYEGTQNYRPSWTPDGRSLVFISDRSGHPAVYRAPADGSGSAVLLHDDPRAIDEAGLSRDGRWLVYRAGSGGGRDIYAIRPGVDSVPTPIATSPFEEYSPALSPDGRWVAYTSEESGQPEVYVRPFPNAQAARWQVSRAGGTEPAWAHSGRELFYRSAAEDFVAVEVTTTPSFRVEAERVLFSARDYPPDAWNRAYAISPDDHSFLFVRHRTGAQSQLIMVTNWFEELKAKVGK